MGWWFAEAAEMLASSVSHCSADLNDVANEAEVSMGWFDVFATK